MSKFNVGDRIVRTIQGGSTLPLGWEATVQKVAGNYIYIKDSNLPEENKREEGGIWFPENFEIAQSFVDPIEEMFS